MLARHNKARGRAEESNIDISVYCPHEFLQAGGPLFANVEDIAAKLNHFLSSRLDLYKLDFKKCLQCGFPDCHCLGCDHRNKGLASNSREKHSCMLKDTRCPKGGNYPKEGWYNAEQKQHLLLAWQTLGVNDLPFFQRAGKKSGYYWQEELTQPDARPQQHQCNVAARSSWQR